MIRNWKDTYWKDGEDTITIKEVLDILKDKPTVSLPINNLSHIPSTEINSLRKQKADLSFPIIVLVKDGYYTMILDGHHRRQKAIEIGRTHILAKLAKVSEIENHG